MSMSNKCFGPTMLICMISTKLLVDVVDIKLVNDTSDRTDHVTGITYLYSCHISIDQHFQIYFGTSSPAHVLEDSKYIYVYN